jgi:hypothetical protein
MEHVMRSHSNDSARHNDTDASESQRHPRPQSFGQRHALKIMGVIMAAMFATVIIAQVAC